VKNVFHFVVSSKKNHYEKKKINTTMKRIWVMIKQSHFDNVVFTKMNIRKEILSKHSVLLSCCNRGADLTRKVSFFHSAISSQVEVPALFKITPLTFLYCWSCSGKQFNPPFH
jgi:hypothetical protein